MDELREQKHKEFIAKLKKESSQRKLRRLNFKNILRPIYIGIGLIVAAVVALAIVLIIHLEQKPAPAQSLFPASIIKELPFKFYYLKPGFSTDFQLQTSSINYDPSIGVLVFNMESNDGKILAFSEETWPKSYDISTLQADKQYDNGYGQVYITDGVTQTTGALFTSDRTWVLINAPSPIGADLMQQIIDNLSSQSVK